MGVQKPKGRLGPSISFVGGSAIPPYGLLIVLGEAVVTSIVPQSKDVLRESLLTQGAEKYVAQRRPDVDIRARNRERILRQTVGRNEEEHSNRCAHQYSERTVTTHHHSNSWWRESLGYGLHIS